MLRYKKIGLTVKPHLEDKEAIVQKIVDVLKHAGAEIHVDHSSMSDVACVRNEPELDGANDMDLLLVIGGDGTILRSVRILPDFSIPILSINQGLVGFLTELTLEEAASALPALLEGKGVLDERGILSVKVTRDENEMFHSFALNEAAISQGSIARILDLQTSVNNEPLATYHSDGLIIATPTGSTAYSLAAGGPVVHPHLPALILTAINPHSLAQKPVVLSGESIIDVDVINTNDRYAKTHVSLTLDGQVYFELNRDDRVTASMHDQTIKFLRRKGEHFSSALRTKLKWGESF